MKIQLDNDDVRVACNYNLKMMTNHRTWKLSPFQWLLGEHTLT